MSFTKVRKQTMLLKFVFTVYLIYYPSDIYPVSDINLTHSLLFVMVSIRELLRSLSRVIVIFSIPT